MPTNTPTVARTLYKTLAVLGLTVLFMLSLRLSTTDMWLSVYRLAGATDETEQERLIVMAVALVCCLLAIGVVEIADRLLMRRSAPRKK